MTELNYNYRMHFYARNSTSDEKEKRKFHSEKNNENRFVMNKGFLQI